MPDTATLDSLLDEAFGTASPKKVPDTATLDSLLDEAFGAKPSTPVHAVNAYSLTSRPDLASIPLLDKSYFYEGPQKVPDTLDSLLDEAFGAKPSTPVHAVGVPTSPTEPPKFTPDAYSLTSRPDLASIPPLDKSYFYEGPQKTQGQADTGLAINQRPQGSFASPGVEAAMQAQQEAQTAGVQKLPWLDRMGVAIGGAVAGSLPGVTQTVSGNWLRAGVSGAENENLDNPAYDVSKFAGIKPEDQAQIAQSAAAARQTLGPISTFAADLASMAPSMVEPKAIVAMMATHGFGTNAANTASTQQALDLVQQKFGPRIADAVHGVIANSVGIGSFSGTQTALSGGSAGDILKATGEGALMGPAFGALDIGGSLLGKGERGVGAADAARIADNQRAKSDLANLGANPPGQQVSGAFTNLPTFPGGFTPEKAIEALVNLSSAQIRYQAQRFGVPYKPGQDVQQWALDVVGKIQGLYELNTDAPVAQPPLVEPEALPDPQAPDSILNRDRVAPPGGGTEIASLGTTGQPSPAQRDAVNPMASIFGVEGKGLDEAGRQALRAEQDRQALLNMFPGTSLMMGGGPETPGDFAAERDARLAAQVAARDYGSMPVVALREEAGRRGLDAAGGKSVLVARLQEHDAVNSPVLDQPQLPPQPEPGTPRQEQVEPASTPSTESTTTGLDTTTQPQQDPQAGVGTEDTAPRTQGEAAQPDTTVAGSPSPNSTPTPKADRSKLTLAEIRAEASARLGGNSKGSRSALIKKLEAADEADATKKTEAAVVPESEETAPESTETTPDKEPKAAATPTPMSKNQVKQWNKKFEKMYPGSKKKVNHPFFSRGDVGQRIVDLAGEHAMMFANQRDARGEGEDFGSMATFEENATTNDVGSGANTSIITRYKGAFPTDLEEMIKGLPNTKEIRKMFEQVPSDYRGQTWKESIDSVGYEAYLNELQARAGNKVPGAVSMLNRVAGEGNPYATFLLNLHDAMKGGGRVSAKEQVSPEDLPIGSEFILHGIRMRVGVATEGHPFAGERIIAAEDGTFRDVPVDALPVIPVDKGSLVKPKGVKKYVRPERTTTYEPHDDSEPEVNLDRFDVKKKDRTPWTVAKNDETGLFGQNTAAKPGEQFKLFGGGEKALEETAKPETAAQREAKYPGIRAKETPADYEKRMGTTDTGKMFEGEKKPGSTRENPVQRFKVGDKVRFKESGTVATITKVRNTSVRDEQRAGKELNAMLDGGSGFAPNPFLREYDLSGEKNRNNRNGLYGADDSMLELADGDSPRLDIAADAAHLSKGYETTVTVAEPQNVNERAARNVIKKMGREAVFLEAPGERFNGVSFIGVPKRIYIRTGMKPEKIANAVLHEIVHSLEAMDPDLYKTLKDLAGKEAIDAAAKDYLDDAIAEFGKDHPYVAGLKRSSKRLEGEGVARVIGKLGEDPKLTARLTKDPTIIDRIKDFVRKVLAKFGYPQGKIETVMGVLDKAKKRATEKSTENISKNIRGSERLNVSGREDNSLFTDELGFHRKAEKLIAEKVKGPMPAGDIRNGFGNSKVDQTQSPEFLKWFGESKVVDKDGKPLRVYHGTNRGDFASFAPWHNKQGAFGEGYYFTDHPEAASNFAKDRSKSRGGDAAVVPAYVSLKNPLEIGSEAYYKFFKDRGYDPGSFESHVLAKDAARAGYDGIISDWQEKPWDESKRQIVAFSPEQIKSATGNTGAFDPKNPDIRFDVPSRNKGGKSKPEETPAKDYVRPKIRDMYTAASTIAKRVAMLGLKATNHDLLASVYHVLQKDYPQFLDKRKEIARMTRGIILSAKDGNKALRLTNEGINRATKSLLDNLQAMISKKADAISAAKEIEKTWDQGLKIAKGTSRIVAKETRRETLARASVEIDAVQDQLRKAQKQLSAAGKYAREDAIKGDKLAKDLIGAKNIIKLKEAAAKIVKNALPSDLRGDYLGRVSRVRTLKDMGNIMGDMAHDVVEHEAGLVIKAAQKSAKGKWVKGLDDVQTVRYNDAVKVVKDARDRLSAYRRGALKLTPKELRGVVDDAKAAHAVIVGTKAVRDAAEKVRVMGKVTTRESYIAKIESGLSKQKDRTQNVDGILLDPKNTPQKIINVANGTMWALASKVDGPNGDHSMRELVHDAPAKAETAVLADTQRGDAAVKKMAKDAGTPLGSPEFHRLSALTAGYRRALKLRLTLPDAGKVVMTHAEAVDLAGLLKNDNARAKIEAGNPLNFDHNRKGKAFSFTPADVAEIERQMPGHLSVFADAMHNHMESNFDALNQAQYRQTGEYLKQQKWYWPLDRNYVGKKPETMIGASSAAVRHSLQNLNMVQALTEDKKTPILIRDAFKKFHDHNHEVAAITHMTEPVRNMEAVLQDKRLVGKIENAYGPRMTKALAEHIEQTKLVWKPQTSLADRAITAATRRVSGAVISLNPDTFLRHYWGSIPKLLNETSAKNFAVGAAHQYDARVTDVLRTEPYWIDRYNRPMRTLFTDSGDGGGSAMGEMGIADALKEIVKGGFVTKRAWAGAKTIGEKIRIINTTDAQVARLAIAGKFAEGEAKWLTGQALKEYASWEAQMQFRRSMGTSSPIDMTSFARENRGKYISVLNALKSPINKNYNMIMGANGKAAQAKACASIGMSLVAASLAPTAFHGVISAVRGKKQAVSRKDQDFAKMSLGSKIVDKSVDAVKHVSGTVVGGTEIYDMLNAGYQSYAHHRSPIMYDPQNILMQKIIDLGRGVAEFVHTGPKDTTFTKRTPRQIAALEEAASAAGALFGLKASAIADFIARQQARENAAKQKH